MLPERIDRADVREDFDREAVRVALLAILYNGLVAARNRNANGESAPELLDYLHNVPTFVDEPRLDDLIALWNYFPEHFLDARPSHESSGFAPLLRAIARPERWDEWQRSIDAVPREKHNASSRLFGWLFFRRRALTAATSAWFVLLVLARLAIGTERGAAMGWPGATRFVLLAAAPWLCSTAALLVAERAARRRW